MTIREKEKEKTLHEKLIDWLGNCERSQSESLWNEEAEEDYRFYAGDQDTTDVKTALMDQNRAATVYNEIMPKVNMLIGLGSQIQEESTLLPRKSEDEPLVEVLGGTMNHYRHKLRLHRLEVGCFEHMVKSGRSFQHFYTDASNPLKPQIKSKRIPGRFVHVDPDSIEYDLSDARYMFVDKWLDEDDIAARWPQFKTESVKPVHQTGGYQPTFFNEANEKYRLVEGWYRKLELWYYFLNPLTGKEESMIEENWKSFLKSIKKGLQLPDGEMLQRDDVPAVAAYKKVEHYAIFDGHEVLEEGRSTYTHNMFPYILYGAYKDDDTNTWMSVVKSMKDPQRGLNTTRRQLVHLLQTSPKGILMHEVGALLNEEDYDDNSSKPNFRLEVGAGKLDKLKFSAQPQISPVYGQLDGLFQQSMKDSSGVQDSLMGIQTSSREPGITVQMRQESGVAVLYQLFDNFSESKHLAAKQLLSMIQQYVTEEEVIRIEGPEGAQLLQINNQMNPQVEGFNDVSAGEFDIIIDEEVATKSMRLAVAQMLTDFSHNNPNTIPADLIMEYTNLPYSAKQKVKAYTEMLRKQEQANFEAEMDLKRLEIEAKNQSSADSKNK